MVTLEIRVGQNNYCSPTGNAHVTKEMHDLIEKNLEAFFEAGVKAMNDLPTKPADSEPTPTYIDKDGFPRFSRGGKKNK